MNKFEFEHNRKPGDPVWYVDKSCKEAKLRHIAISSLQVFIDESGTNAIWYQSEGFCPDRLHPSNCFDCKIDAEIEKEKYDKKNKDTTMKQYEINQVKTKYKD